MGRRTEHDGWLSKTAVARHERLRVLTKRSHVALHLESD